MNTKKTRMSEEALERTAAVLAEKIKIGQLDDIDDPKLERELIKLKISSSDSSTIKYLIGNYL